jgi:hypothetical protein
MFHKVQLVMTGAVLALAVGALAIPAQSASKHCTSEECACEEALNKNTVEALEEFLRKYPNSTSSANSACGALAVPPQGEGSGPSDQGAGEGGTIRTPTGASSEG